MTGFAASVAAFVEKAKGQMDEAFRATALDAVARVQELTPVDTGYLRANWSAIKKGDAVPVPGAPTIDAIADAKIGDTIVIVNPVEYARAVEFGFVGEDANGHHHNRSGAGMVAQTVTELPDIAAAATARVIDGKSDD